MPLEEVRANYFLTEKPVYDSIPDKYCKSEVVGSTPRVVERNSVCPRFLLKNQHDTIIVEKTMKEKRETNVNCVRQVRKRKKERTFLL